MEASQANNLGTLPVGDSAVIEAPSKNNARVRQKNTMSEIERRSTRRYPLQLQVRYRATSARLSLSGSGQTLNISSAGLLIASSQAVREGLRLQLNVDWPWLLDDRTPLQLIAESRVVRADASQFAVTLERYQFRTSKRQSAPVDPLIWAVTA